MKIDKEYEAMIAETTKRRTVKPTPEVNKGNESAQTAWMRKLRGDMNGSLGRFGVGNGAVVRKYIQELLAWGNARKVRTAARPGGVGRR